MLLEGSVVETITGKYKLNQKKKTTNIQFEDYTGEFVIETLNNKELYLKDKKQEKLPGILDINLPHHR